MAHWTENQTLLGYFYKEAHAISHQAGIMVNPPRSEEESLASESMRADMAMFIAEVRPLSHYQNPTQALEAYKKWVVPEEARVVPCSNQRTFSASITKNYGDLSVSFGYSAEFKVRSEREVSEAYRFVMTAIHQQFAAFERGELASVRAADGSPQSRETTEDEVEVDSIEVEIKGGKRYYKVKGGKYAKYGIRVWPETLADAGLDPSVYQPGDNKISPRKVKALFDGEKPQKVIKFL